MADLGRKIAAPADRLPDRAVLPEAGDQPFDREPRQVCAGIAAQDARRVNAAHLGQRAGDRSRNAGTPRHRGLGSVVAERHGVDQVGVVEDGRAFEHQCGNVGLVCRQRQEQVAGHVDRRRHGFGQSPPDERRRVVEQDGQRPLGFGMRESVELGIEERPGEAGRGVGAFLGAGLLCPGEKLRYQHGAPVQLSGHR